MRELALDNPGVVAMYTHERALGGSIPMDESVPGGWLTQRSANASATQAAAMHLPADRVDEIRIAGLDSLEIVNCRTLDQILSLLAERKVSVCVVDVSLADCWPTHAADLVLEASSASTSIVFVCTGSERDAIDIIARCSKTSNAHVVLADRLSAEDIIKICNGLALLSHARPEYRFD